MNFTPGLIAAFLSVNLLFNLSAQVTQAAVASAALELLAMPEPNRILIAKEKSQELFPSMIKLSQSDSESMQTRWKALTLAAELNPKLALPELEKALHSPLWYMRNASLVAMQTQPKQTAQKAALFLLNDKALVVRSAAVEALQPDLDASSRDLLWEEMGARHNFRKDQSLWVREQILAKLAVAPEPRESALFFKALREKNNRMHEPAILALEQLNHQKLAAASEKEKENSAGKNTDKTAQKTAQKRELWLRWAKAHSESATSEKF